MHRAIITKRPEVSKGQIPLPLSQVAADQCLSIFKILNARSDLESNLARLFYATKVSHKKA